MGTDFVSHDQAITMSKLKEQLTPCALRRSSEDISSTWSIVRGSIVEDAQATLSWTDMQLLFGIKIFILDLRDLLASSSLESPSLGAPSLASSSLAASRDLD